MNEIIGHEKWVPGITLPIVSAQELLEYGRKEHFYDEEDEQEGANDQIIQSVGEASPAPPSFGISSVENFSFEQSQDSVASVNIRTLKGPSNNSQDAPVGASSAQPGTQKIKGKSMSELFNLAKHHDRNVTGKGVKIAIFDSGLADKYLRENKELEVREEQLKREKDMENLSYLQMLQDPDAGQIKVSDGEEISDEIEEDKRTGSGTNERSEDTSKSATDLRVAKVIDFTFDSNTEDKIGHGTFITSVVASLNKDCPGIAPDAEVYIFKVFTENR